MLGIVNDYGKLDTSKVSFKKTANIKTTIKIEKFPTPF